jgi:hypothetical protein
MSPRSKAERPDTHMRSEATLPLPAFRQALTIPFWASGAPSNSRRKFVVGQRRAWNRRQGGLNEVIAILVVDSTDCGCGEILYRCVRVLHNLILGQ